uniref:Uncharacterized protein n=1 Tax=Alexandrium monilatum TaxID=311494 RepID=A0A7S4Q925_9DINO
MHYAMIFAVEQGVEALQHDAEQFQDGVPGGHYWGCDCFPEHLRADVYKAFVRGMVEIMVLLGAMLKAERLPLLSEVMRLLAPFTPAPGRELGLRLNKHAISHFFGKGGKVDYILRSVIEDATTFYEEREGGEEDECDRRDFHEYYGLPNHMLDGDFDFVRSALIPQYVTGT